MSAEKSDFKTFNAILEEKMQVLEEKTKPYTASVKNYEIWYNCEKFYFKPAHIRYTKPQNPSSSHGKQDNSEGKQETSERKVASSQIKNHSPNTQSAAMAKDIEPFIRFSKLSSTGIATLKAFSICEKSHPAGVQLKTVKSAWRKMARKLHPDLNPNAKSHEFAKMRDLYNLLIKELMALAL